MRRRYKSDCGSYCSPLHSASGRAKDEYIPALNCKEYFAVPAGCAMPGHHDLFFVGVRHQAEELDETVVAGDAVILSAQNSRRHNDLGQMANAPPL